MRSSFARDDEIAAQSCRNRHASEATNATGDHTNDWLVSPQIDDGRMNLSDRRESEIRFLQAHAAGFDFYIDALAPAFGFAVSTPGHRGPPAILVRPARNACAISCQVPPAWICAGS